MVEKEEEKNERERENKRKEKKYIYLYFLKTQTKHLPKLWRNSVSRIFEELKASLKNLKNIQRA